MRTLDFMVREHEQVIRLTAEHLNISLLGVLYGLLVGVPLGMLIIRYKAMVEPVLWLANLLQTIPALALVGFVMIFTGLTPTTGIVAIFLYSLLPIVRATYTGITGVDRGVIEAANGMGMTRFQILYMVQLPLSLSVILVGVRIATVIGIGTASIMSLAGAGGLGGLIFRGIDRVSDPMILAGALPAALLAVIAQLGIGYLEKRLSPNGPSPSH